MKKIYLNLFLIPIALFSFHFANAAQTITGEVSVNKLQDGPVSDICQRFQLGIVAGSHHDMQVLSKTPMGLTSELQACKAAADNLVTSLNNGSFQTVSSATPIALRENYYYVKNYLYEVATNGFYYFHYEGGEFKYEDKNFYDYFANGYSATSPYVCRIHLDKSNNALLAYEIRNRATGTTSRDTQIIDRCVSVPVQYNCAHNNAYKYNFDYRINQDGNLYSIDDTVAHKCEDMSLAFSHEAEWSGSLISTVNPDIVTVAVPLTHDIFVSPPTSFMTCADQTSCFNGVPEYQLTESTWGKGTQRIPENFVTNTQNSLNSNGDSNVTCSNGKCIAYLSGQHTLASATPATSYFGECRGEGITVDLPETPIAAASNNYQVNIVDRPPVATVSFSKTQFDPNEEVEAYCDVVDPDDCVDKISKVKWVCINDQGQQVNCFLGKDGVWKEGTLLDEVSTANMTNPYRSTVKFKASQVGSYALTCEAWDNDSVQSSVSSSLGIGGVQVCNAGECGVIAAHMQICAIMADSEKSKDTICSNDGKAKFKIYSWGIDPVSYQWKCSDNANTETISAPNGATKECTYSSTGTYNPSLSIVDKSGKTIECTSTTSVNIQNQAKCNVRVRKQGSTNDYSNSVDIQMGDSVEAKVEKECLEGGEPQWTAVNGTLVSQNKDTAVFKFNTSGTSTVKADITKDGNKTSCDGAQVNIRSVVRQGQ